MKYFSSYIKNFWKTDVLVLLFLIVFALMQFFCKQDERVSCWVMSSIILPYVISFAANISTSKIELKKTSDMKHAKDFKEAEMKAICSEVVGFLEAMTPDEENLDKKRIKKILTKIKKMQLAI